MATKLTKGYIKNVNTSEVMAFMYNPESMSISRSANYAEVVSPGNSYPYFQYTGGNSKEISFKLFLAGNNRTVKNWISFLEGFHPSEGYSVAVPSTLIFSFGVMVKECVLVDLNLNYQMWDFNLNPTMVEADIKLKVV